MSATPASYARRKPASWPIPGKTSPRSLPRRSAASTRAKLHLNTGSWGPWRTTSEPLEVRVTAPTWVPIRAARFQASSLHLVMVHEDGEIRTPRRCRWYVRGTGEKPGCSTDGVVVEICRLAPSGPPPWCRGTDGFSYRVDDQVGVSMPSPSSRWGHGRRTSAPFP